jgi:hypothetical protein
MSFVVVRHPDITAPGVIPVAALEHHRLRGWFRVSEERPQPSDFHLAAYADAENLDAPEPEPEPEVEPEPTRPSRRSRAKEQ